MTSPVFQEPTDVAVPSESPADGYEGPAKAMQYVTDEAELLHRINQKLDVLIAKSDAHTNAVNHFGGMLDYVVQSVAGFSKSIQEQGIGGLMKMMSGGGGNG